jgi:hypothetical protein
MKRKEIISEYKNLCEEFLDTYDQADVLDVPDAIEKFRKRLDEIDNIKESTSLLAVGGKLPDEAMLNKFFNIFPDTMNFLEPNQPRWRNNRSKNQLLRSRLSNWRPLIRKIK